MTALIKKRKEKEIISHDKSRPLHQPSSVSSAVLPLSPNPIRLSFIPRSVQQQKSNVTDRAKSTSKRAIRFIDAGQITAILEITDTGIQKIDGEECDDGRISPYRSSTSSDATPTSITDELTNVPEPHEIQKLLKANNLLNGYGNEHSSNEQPTEISTPKAEKLINGFTKSKIAESSLINGDNKIENRNLSQNKNLSAQLAVNGIKKYLNVTPVKENSLQARPKIVCSNGSDNTSPSTSAMPQTNGVRKRLLSDRGEQESQYPKINQATMFYSWSGCQFLMFGRQSAVGLYNPMNNCFLNSVLQAVVHLPHLARMILETKDMRMCNMNNSSDCFHCALKEHIKKAIQVHQPFQPAWMNRFFKKIFPHHRIGVQEDAHEMLTLLLGALEPLPPKQTPNGLKMNGPTLSTPIEQIFGGNLRNQVICNVCKHVHTNYERIREINLGLTRNVCSPIAELVADFFKPEQLQNFLCSNCKKKNSATRYTTLLSSPIVLIIQLKRFNAYGGKNRTPVKIKGHLNMKSYAQKTDNTESDVVYKLHGLIEHIGGGLNFGHYVCAMRGFDGRSWFLFDDSDRRSISDDYIEKMEPYILFYTKVVGVRNEQLRRSFEGCQPKMAKQPRMANNSIGPFNRTNMLNRTFTYY